MNEAVAWCFPCTSQLCSWKAAKKHIEAASISQSKFKRPKKHMLPSMKTMTTKKGNYCHTDSCFGQSFISNSRFQDLYKINKTTAVLKASKSQTIQPISILFSFLHVFLICMKKCFTENNFYLPLRILDSYSIFVDDLPNDLRYRQIKATFWPYQPYAPLQILKKDQYLIITFEKEETVQKVQKEKDQITLQGKRVTIKQAYKQFKAKLIHLPFSFFSLLILCSLCHHSIDSLCSLLRR